MLSIAVLGGQSGNVFRVELSRRRYIYHTFSLTRERLQHIMLYYYTGYLGFAECHLLCLGRSGCGTRAPGRQKVESRVIIVLSCVTRAYTRHLYDFSRLCGGGSIPHLFIGGVCRYVTTYMMPCVVVFPRIGRVVSKLSMVWYMEPRPLLNHRLRTRNETSSIKRLL